MPFLVLEIFKVAGALALFIFGMKVMSDGIQKAAGGQLRKTLRNITKRPINAVLVGLVTTGIIQSSSATTVMTISFVNAGLITVTQSAGLIIGANIGTTITAWLVSLGGFLFSLSAVTLPLLAIAVPVFFRGGKRNRYWAEFLIGFSLVFIGLGFLKDSLPNLGNQEVFEYIRGFAKAGLLARLLFIFIGLMITILVQSSSAALTLILAMCFNGWIPFELAAAMILGSNIGTTVTAEIAALVANAYARQSASFHTLFNVLGATWMVIAMPIILDGIIGIVGNAAGEANAIEDPNLRTVGLAAFHTTFNVLNAIVALPLLKYLIKMAERLRAPRSEKDRRAKLKYLDYSIATPELSTVEIQLELLQLAEIIEQMVQRSRKLFNSTEEQEKIDAFKWLRKQDKRVSKHNEFISEYVIELAKQELSDKTSSMLQRYLRMSNDLVRISNNTNTICLEVRDKTRDGIWFTPHQRNTINEIYSYLVEGISIMRDNLECGDPAMVSLDKAHMVEASINQIRDELRNTTLKMSKEFDFNLQGTLVYYKIFSLLENIGDKVLEVSKLMKGK
ncbi:MAG: Na/Pi cotransporter family protein [Bacteroidota bacterium]